MIAQMKAHSRTGRIISVIITAAMMITAFTGIASQSVYAATEVAYPVTGGNIYFDTRYNTVTKCDNTVTEIVIPEEYMGDVMGNLTARRGRIEGMEARGNGQVIRAMVPLSEMFGYATDLRSTTQGRGVFTMQFSHYEEAPKFVLEKVTHKA